MNTARRILDVAVGASVTVFLISCGEATETLEEPVDKEPARNQSASEFGSGKADSFDTMEAFDRERSNSYCNESDAADDPDCHIRIASWNIQWFSANKSRKDEVMERIAETVENVDVLAVQEIKNIREQSDPGCPRNEECPNDENCGAIRQALDEHLNKNRSDNYGIAFSPQVRHERYLYIWDKDRVELLTHKLVDDPGDSEPVCAWRPEDTGTMVRQPHLGVFRAGDFTFSLLNAHIAPLDAQREIEALLDFEKKMRRNGFSDVVVVGDLNADCGYLSQIQQDEFASSEYFWLFRGADTAVAKEADCGYDQMIVTEPTIEDLTGELGVARTFEDESVSDHFPIWANFYTDRDTDTHAERALSE